ncbi:MAG: MlaD family protein [Kiritimatiellia bacterium]
MSKKANPTIIGLFVVTGLVIALGAVLVLGSGSLRERPERFVLYFEGDLNGLDVGAPVTSRGVKIGVVDSVTLEFDRENSQLHTPVIISILPGSFVDTSSGSRMTDISDQIERGLRARLGTISMVTGKLRIILDYFPDTTFELHHKRRSDVREIPTIPTTMESVISKLQEMPVDKIMEDFQASMNTVSAFFQSGRLEENTDKLSVTLDSLNSILKEAEIANVLDSVNQTLVESQAALAELSSASRPMQYEFSMAMAELTDAARSIRNLADYLERHPEALLRGKGE